MKVIHDIYANYEEFIKEKLKGTSYIDNQKFMDDLVKWQHEWLSMNGVTDEMIISQSLKHHKETLGRECPKCKEHEMSDGTGTGWEVCGNCGYMA